MRDVRLGGTVIRHGVMLAPMAGAADYAMRRICRDHGLSYAVTEMVSAKAMEFGDKKTLKLAAVREDDAPLAVQIFGSDPDSMAKAAARLAGLRKESPTSAPTSALPAVTPAAIDVNMGCPVPKIVKNGDGSALMRDPALVSRIVDACVRALDGTGVPLTVKIRAGWNANRNAVEVARAAEAAGAAMIVVHGRTREQMYAPPVDLGVIADVKAAVRIPVIGNGDVRSYEDAEAMTAATGCDGVAIGRGALGNPWIFEEIGARIRGEEWTPPTREMRVTEAIRHVRLLVEDKGEHIGAMEARKQFAWYIHGMRGAPAIRDRIMRSASVDEMSDILTEWISAGEN